MEKENVLKEWLEKLKFSGEKIIVEGKKDKEALIALGIDKSSIIILNKPLFSVVEDATEAGKTSNRVVILTDFDREGKELYGKLKKDFVRHGIEVDNYFREFLQKNTKLSHVEGIISYNNQHNNHISQNF